MELSGEFLQQRQCPAVRSSSLKRLEPIYGFKRQTPLEESRKAMRYVEHRLELGWGDEPLPDGVRSTMEGYNSEDCFSTAALRDWLEKERRRLENGGVDMPRPPEKSGDPSEKLQEKLDRAAALTRNYQRRFLWTLPHAMTSNPLSGCSHSY
jgi:uncharacterized protein